MKCRLLEGHARRRNAVEPLARLGGVRVTPDPAFRAALRDRLIENAPTARLAAPQRPAEALSGPGGRRRARNRRPRLLSGLVVAALVLGGHLAACVQPENPPRPVAPGGHEPRDTPDRR